MHIYNTTFGIDPAVEAEFLDWLKAEFIPAATSDGEYFHTPELMRVVTADPEANSIALHLRADSTDDIAKWYEDHGARLFAHIQKTWNGHVVFFSTTLTLI